MFEGLQSVVASTLGPLTYKDGVLSRKTYIDNGKGTMDKTVEEFPVKVQVDALTQSMLVDGAAEDDVRLLVIAEGLPDERLRDDDLIIVEAETFAVIAPSRDPMNTHWRCRGRRKTGVNEP